MLQYSVHTPSPFICRHGDNLLPTWSSPISSVLIVLQQASCNLLARSRHTEDQKHQLRERFLQLGRAIATQLQQQGYLADLFDPKTGLPILSPPGQLWLDDVAVVRACLDYPTTEVEGCSVVIHPTWGSATYPSVLLSSAKPEQVEQLAKGVVWMGGLVDNEVSCRTLSEYHHSLTGAGSLTQ